MGLIKAAIGSVGGVLADQWKEFFYCDSLNENILMAKGQKRTSRHGRSGNTDGEDNIISNGSRIAVNNGQCMLIVESGKIVEVCAEPGEYTYDASTEASIFDGDYAGDLGESFRLLVRQMKERFAFGGDTGKDQRVYYVNLKEIIGNKYGTPSEVPFKSYDDTTGLALLMRLRCFGEYSYRVVNPILFYTNVAGNDVDVYERSRLDSQLKSELLTALQPAFARISALHIDYSQLPGHTPELVQALNEVLSPKWRDLRGIEIVSIGINSVKANEEDEEKIQKAQMGLTMSRPDIGLGTLVDATADSMRTAAANEGGMGAAMGYMGMNMANQRAPGPGTGSPPGGPGAFADAAGCAGRQLDLCLRSVRQHGELLHGLRPSQTADSRCLDLPEMRPGREYGQLLQQLRRAAAPGSGQLDLPVLRDCQYGEFLYELRCKEAGKVR